MTIATGAVAFLTACVLTPLLREMAKRRGRLDQPNERSSHAVPTPRNGGISILAGVVAGATASGALAERAMFATLVGALVIALLGDLDERFSLPTLLRLAVQSGAAAAILLIAAPIGKVTPFPSLPLLLGMFAFPISLFWIAGLMNGYNFMDGLNGIASLEAIVCGAALAVMLFRNGDVAGAALCVAVACAAAGFLPWNLPSGSIFMGDTGSAPLGFLLAVLVVRATNRDVSFLAAMLPLMPFVSDTSLTLLRRLSHRENVFSAHRTHYYQRLQRSGLSHAAVTMLWGGMAAVCSVVAIALDSASPAFAGSMLAAIATMHVVVFAAIDRRWRRVDQSAPR
jgi:UDP-N-acetylmuramyl pentapeptide phosphotransferase/UDP-N-acetylglucosamine-1-phosphate transferase